MVVVQAVEDNGDGVCLSLERSGREDGVAVLAIPKLHGFKFLSPFSSLYDLRARAIEAAFLTFADDVIL